MANLPPYSRREPLAIQIRRQQAKLATLEERLGRMMSQRVIEEEKLADLFKLQRRLECLDEYPFKDGAP